MKTGTHPCSCGHQFGLKVELAWHCQQSGHVPVVVDTPAPLAVEPPAPAAPPAPRRRLRLSPRLARPLLAATLLASLLGFNVMMERAVQTCTAAAHIVAP